MSDNLIKIPPAAFAAVDELRQRLEAVAPSKYLVGIGMKETAGRFQDRLAVFVYVDDKQPIQRDSRSSCFSLDRRYLYVAVHHGGAKTP